jgi:hypothetical protein
MTKVNKKISCWKCKHLDKSDVSDYKTVSFCGHKSNKEIEEDLSNGELHPVGKCFFFEPKDPS